MMLPPLLERIGVVGERLTQPHIAMFHMHTHFSHDSAMRPECFVRFARKYAVSILCVTDHGTTQGSRRVAQMIQETGGEVVVPIAMEAYAKEGHIGCIGIQKDITAKVGSDIVKEVRCQGGVSVYNHPYQASRTPDMRLAELVDFIEYPNNRTPAHENLKALQLAMRLRKPVLPGCDAHQPKELYQGLVQIVYDAGQEQLMATPLPANRLTSVDRAYELLLKTFKNRNMTYVMDALRHRLYR